MDNVAAHTTLGVSLNATPDEIRAAYRRRAFETHPDRADGSTAEFQAVAEAYRVLSDSTRPAHDQGQDSSSRVPGMDAAKVLFEYLSDLASEMILNGAAPDAIVSFLAQEGCPESVARALEHDLRRRVQPAASEGAPRATDRAARDPSPFEAEVSPRGPAARPGPRRRGLPPFARWVALALAAPAVMACALMVWRITASAGASEPHAEIASPNAALAAPESPPPAPAAPARSSAPRPRPPHGEAQRQPDRQDQAHSLRAVSTQLDAERAALEADRERFAAEAAELQAQRQSLDAAEAALAAGGNPAQLAALRRQQAAYDARFEAARRTEKELRRRTHELNARIVAYNGRVRSAHPR